MKVTFNSETKHFSAIDTKKFSSRTLRLPNVELPTKLDHKAKPYDGLAYITSGKWAGLIGEANYRSADEDRKKRNVLFEGVRGISKYSDEDVAVGICHVSEMVKFLGTRKEAAAYNHSAVQDKEYVKDYRYRTSLSPRKFKEEYKVKIF